MQAVTTSERNPSRASRGRKENALKAKFNGGPVPLGKRIDSEHHYQIGPAASFGQRLDANPMAGPVCRPGLESATPVLGSEEGTLRMAERAASRNAAVCRRFPVGIFIIGIGP